jgi:alkylation response protein AidB-like acyl-CoA dehydrogenase
MPQVRHDGAMAVTRAMPTPESAELIALVREIRAAELAPIAAEYEERAEFPRQVFRTLGKTGILGLPYPARYGGGEQPSEVVLQVLEELAQSWLTVALGVSVHWLSCHPVATFGSAQQQERFLPEMVAGELLGAYALSEPHSGSDAAALSTRAVPTEHGYRVTGSKAWITHGGVADYVNVMARTSDAGSRGITCLLVPGDAPGLSAAPAERKMGLTGSTTAALQFDDVPVAADRRIGAEGQGFAVAMAALDAGRLGIAACAVGVAQAALSAARSKDAGRPYRTEAAMAKLHATDAAMRVTTDAVQILGGAGYTRDFPVERYFREAKVLQIVEGTNQVQRMVIGRALRGGR